MFEAVKRFSSNISLLAGRRVSNIVAVPVGAVFYACIIFSGLFFDVSKLFGYDSLVTLLTSSLILFFSAMTVIVSLQNKEKEYREKYLDDMHDEVWGFCLEAIKASRKVVNFKTSRSSIEREEEHLDNLLGEINESIKSLKSKGDDGEAKRAEGIRHDFLERNREKRERLREAKNESFLSMLLDLSMCTTYGEKVSDLVIVYGESYSINKGNCKKLCKSISGIVEKLKLATKKIGEPGMESLEEMNLQDIDQFKGEARDALAEIRHMELSGGNAKDGRYVDFRARMVFWFLAIVLFFSSALFYPLLN